MMDHLSIMEKSVYAVQLYLITLVFTCFTFFQQTLPINSFEHFQMNLGITAQNFIYLASLFFIPYGLMQLPGGIMLDKYGLKHVLPISIALTTIGVAVFWASYSNWMIGFGRIITGLGCSVAYISGIFVATSFFEKSKLPLLICILECSAILGGLISAKPLQSAVDYLGWGRVGAINITLCLLLFIWSYLSSKKIITNIESPRLSLRQLFQGILAILKNKEMLFIFGYSFCTWFVIISFPGYWLKDYLNAVHHYSTATALVFIEIYWTSFLIACLFVGFFTRGFRNTKIILLLLSATAFLTYLIMIQPYLFSYSGLVWFSIFGGISTSGIILAFSLIPWLIESKLNGTAIAMNNTFVVLGGYAGQALFGLVVSYININSYTDILRNSGIEPYHYTALLIYLISTFLALLFAILICCKSSSKAQTDPT